MRRGTVNDKQLVIDILKKSFEDNKSVNYVVKQDVKREERIKGLMEYSFDICMLLAMYGYRTIIRAAL